MFNEMHWNHLNANARSNFNVKATTQIHPLCNFYPRSEILPRRLVAFSCVRYVAINVPVLAGKSTVRSVWRHTDLCEYVYVNRVVNYPVCARLEKYIFDSLLTTFNFSPALPVYSNIRNKCFSINFTTLKSI